MRRGLAWVAGAIGLAALLRALKARQHQPSDVAPPADPSDELRAAIAESRDEETAPEPESKQAQATIEERRQQVHERAQAAIDAMNEPPTGA